jgi:hypothetical protein
MDERSVCPVGSSRSLTFSRYWGWYDARRGWRTYETFTLHYVCHNNRMFHITVHIQYNETILTCTSTSTQDGWMPKLVRDSNKEVANLVT